MNEADILLRLKDACFRIGGSRFMAAKYPESIQIKDDTDFDFYCSYCPEHLDILHECGFKEIDAPDRSYWDNQLIAMFKHPEFAIDVLIRKDVIFYSRAFESITASDFIKYVWKSAPNYIRDENFRRSVCDLMNKIFNDLKLELAETIPF